MEHHRNDSKDGKEVWTTVSGRSRCFEAPTGPDSSDFPESQPVKPTQTPDPSRSQYTKYRDPILSKIEQGLTAQRLYQDLISDYGFMAKYHSVRSYVGALLESKELPVRRMEVTAGQEMQIDYGQRAKCKDHTGQTRRAYSFDWY